MISLAALLGIHSAVLAENRGNHRLGKPCTLCSASTDRDTNGIGIVSFDDLSITPLQICDEGLDMSGYASNITTYRDTKSSILIRSNLDRRIAEVSITLKKGSRPSFQKMSQFICDNCCKKIMQENTCDVAFIDCLTKEVFPIEENTVEFYIGDYAIHRLDCQDVRYDYLIFFAPER